MWNVEKSFLKVFYKNGEVEVGGFKIDYILIGKV